MLYFVLLVLKVKDLNVKVEELEAAGGRRLKAQVASLESKIAGLEDQLESSNRYETSEWVNYFDVVHTA